MALVAEAMSSVTPRLSAWDLKRWMVAMTFTNPGSVIRPSRVTMSPSRRTSLSRARGTKWPSADASTTSRWNEFEPRSMAATRMVVFDGTAERWHHREVGANAG